MICFSEIQPGDLIKVVVVIDDVEDELFAKVADNRGDHFELYYYEETSLTYKGARVHALESELNIIRPESICEHYPGGETIFRHVSDDRYVLEEEMDPEVEDSAFEDDSDDSSSDLRSFVVSDEECELPPDHREVDRAWTEWRPKSEGSRRFKRTIDEIDDRLRALT
jgi:hypothetical protein